MSLLKKPTELTDNIFTKGLIYGQPGVCKSTLALSMPSPVMIDADQGMYRVEKRFQTPSLPLDQYEKVLELLQGNELDPFQTIVFDTLGKLVDRMADYLMRTNPKLRQGDGSLTLKGYGALRVEFQNLLRLATVKNKHLIFVAHEREERDGDTRIVRPDVSGSSGKDLIKDLDYVGYIEMRGGKRTVSFTPSEKFYAKNSLKLPPLIEIPHTDEHPNDFMQRVVIARTLEKVREEDVLAQKYEAIVTSHKQRIANLQSADEANEILKEITASEALWDSARLAKKLLNDKTKELGIVYDKDRGFVQAKKEKEAENASAAQAA